MLWQQAFGDSQEDIDFFVNNCKNLKCIGVLNEYNDVVSMLFVIKCKVKNENFNYIYAACTNKSYRGSGLMTKLLDACKLKYKNLILIPANSDLVEFYTKREFTFKVELNQIIFDETEEIKEYLFDGCCLQHPFALYYKG